MSRPVPDEVILGLLKSNPSHGYDLLQSFQSYDRLGHVWTLSTSQLYAVLKRLEVSGAIEGEEIESIDAPVRIVYSVTDKGTEQLNSWIFDNSPSSSVHRIRVMFLSRLYIASLLGIPIERIVENQRKVCESQLEHFHEEMEKSSASFEKLTLDFIIGQLTSALAWLEQCKEEFAESGTSNRDFLQENKA